MLQLIVKMIPQAMHLSCLICLKLYKDFLKIEHYQVHIFKFSLAPYVLDVPHANEI